jgi:hypothetical protein
MKNDLGTERARTPNLWHLKNVLLRFSTIPVKKSDGGSEPYCIDTISCLDTYYFTSHSIASSRVLKDVAPTPVARFTDLIII